MKTVKGTVTITDRRVLRLLRLINRLNQTPYHWTVLLVSDKRFEQTVRFYSRLRQYAGVAAAIDYCLERELVQWSSEYTIMGPQMIFETLRLTDAGFRALPFAGTVRHFEEAGQFIPPLLDLPIIPD